MDHTTLKDIIFFPIDSTISKDIILDCRHDVFLTQSFSGGQKNDIIITIAKQM
jgi:hypothetical protein